MARIHPTAIVDPSANLADDVQIGAYAVVEPDVSIGPGCVIRTSAVIRRYTTLGANNIVDSFAVLGGNPQDLKFVPGTVSYLRIGDGNVFREGVTISRASIPGNATVVGNGCYWMTEAHAGHDSAVGDECIMINGSALAGHTRLGNKSILSAHVVVHQYCWISEGVMTQGNSAITQHVPPYVITAGVGEVVALNVVGLRRSKEITDLDRKQVREAFDLTYRNELPMNKVVKLLAEHKEWGPAASKFRDFVFMALAAPAPNNRGLSSARWRRGDGGKA